MEGEERVPHLGKTPRWLGDQLGQEGSLGGSEDSAEAHLWQAGQSEMYTDGPCHSASCCEDSDGPLLDRSRDKRERFDYRKGVEIEKNDKKS